MKKLLLIAALALLSLTSARATDYFWIPPVGSWLLIGYVADGEPPGTYVAGSNYSVMVHLYQEARRKQPY